MANLVCPYPPKKTIIFGGTVFAVFDLGQIAYQGPVGGRRSGQGPDEKKSIKILKSAIFEVQKRYTPQKKAENNRHSDLK